MFEKITITKDENNIMTIAFPTLSLKTDCENSQEIKLAIASALCEYFGFTSAIPSLQQIKQLLMAKDCYHQSIDQVTKVQDVIGRQGVFEKIKDIEIKFESDLASPSATEATRRIVLGLAEKIKALESELAVYKR